MKHKGLGRLVYIALISSIVFFFQNCSEAENPIEFDCEFSDMRIEFSVNNPNNCSSKDGSIIPIVTGGKGPFQFSLDGSPFQTGSRFENLGAGIYQLNVKDQNGCIKSISASLQSPESELTASIETTDSGCNLKNGAIIIEPLGGVEPYTYRINNGPLTATNAFFELQSGNYKVDIIDNSGCSTTQTVKVLNGVKFKETIWPILEKNCAISGCHLDQGNITFTKFENIQVRTADMIARIQSGNMPKNRPKLNQNDIDAIICWVNDGALEN
jgi:hypothetical protein